MSTNELTSQVRELKELQQLADDLQAEITTLQDNIKAEMTARSTDEMNFLQRDLDDMIHNMKAKQKLLTSSPAKAVM